MNINEGPIPSPQFVQRSYYTRCIITKTITRSCIWGRQEVDGRTLSKQAQPFTSTYSEAEGHNTV